MRKIQRAVYEIKAAPLSSDWGYSVACEKFGAELIDSFPRYSRGPRKGKLKGFLTWTKCTVGGWSHNHPMFGGSGGVLKPGTYAWQLVATHPSNDPRQHGLVATWSWNGGSPKVDRAWTPTEAFDCFKTYGTEPRYG